MLTTIILTVLIIIAFVANAIFTVAMGRTVNWEAERKIADLKKAIEMEMFNKGRPS